MYRIDWHSTLTGFASHGESIFDSEHAAERFCGTMNSEYYVNGHPNIIHRSRDMSLVVACPSCGSERVGRYPMWAQRSDGHNGHCKECGATFIDSRLDSNRP